MDVFQLQASVNIDTTDASSKLDALIEKAEKLNEKLTDKKTVSSPQESGGSSSGESKSNSSSGSSSGENAQAKAEEKSQIEEVTEEAKKETFWDIVKAKGKEIGTSALNFASLYGTELFAGSAFLAGGIWAANEVSKSDAERRGMIGSFDFTEEQQAAALNYYYNMHNMAPSTVDEGFTVADTAYWDLEESVGEKMAAAFDAALSKWGFSEGYDTGDVTVNDLFSNPEDVEIPVQLDAQEGAEQIEGQVGTVNIPANITVTGISGGRGPLNQNLTLPPFLMDGSHAKGLSYAPFDGYIAELHRGEEIVTAEEKQARGQRGYEPESIVNMMVDTFSDAMQSMGVYMGAERVGDITSNRVRANINQHKEARLRGMGG